jgi:hypothetical protein
VYDSEYWRRNALFTLEEERRVKAIIPGRTWDDATNQINSELDRHLTPRQVSNWGYRHHVHAAELILPKAESVIDPVRERRQQIALSTKMLERLDGAVKARMMRGWSHA